MNTTLVIYTDLDGTLLDEADYSFAPAARALGLVRSGKAFLVPCTSKTRQEVMPLMEKLGFNHPVIVENGGAAYFPGNLFGISAVSRRPHSGWMRMEFGVPYAELTRFLQDIRQVLGFQITGFNDLTAAQIAGECGLTEEEARRAKCREFDEPFRLPAGQEPLLEVIRKAARDRNLSITEGGRFYHLAGGSDKGRAVAALISLFQLRFGKVVTVGLGDSPNDLTMLEKVNLPVVVQRPDGTHHPLLAGKIPYARFVPGIGPAGWNRAICELLGEPGRRPERTGFTPAAGFQKKENNYEHCRNYSS